MMYSLVRMENSCFVDRCFMTKIPFHEPDEPTIFFTICVNHLFGRVSNGRNANPSHGSLAVSVRVWQGGQYHPCCQFG